MVGDISLRTKYKNAILEQIKRELHLSDNDFELIRDRLSKASVDELERTYEAFERFGVCTILNIIKK